MRVIGLLSWYEEPVSWLAACVASAAQLCDHLVAVDGPYALFPGAAHTPASGSEQADVIAHTAAGAGMGCTIHAPRRPWLGGEVGKRDFMFRLGLTFAEPGEDWFLRIDADEVLTEVPPDTRGRLAATDRDVAEVTLWARGDVDTRDTLRVLFRALPGIGVQQAHYLVTAPGTDRTRVLCGDPAKHRAEPALDLWDVRLEHRNGQRSQVRQALKGQYYAYLPQIEQVSEL